MDINQTAPPEKCPLFGKSLVHKKGTFSNFWTFEIASLPNVPGHYSGKYGSYTQTIFRSQFKANGENTLIWSKSTKLNL